MANAVLEPVDLSLPSMKELGAKWLAAYVAEYLVGNPQFMVNRFIHHLSSVLLHIYHSY